MIGWIFRSLLLVVLCSTWITGWSAGKLVAQDISLEDVISEKEIEVPVSGISLQRDVAQDLAKINLVRESRKDSSLGRSVFLEKVSFERVAGGVIAKGTVLDLFPSRNLVVVLDGFDANKNYIGSGSSTISTLASSMPFSVSMDDKDEYQSFAVRFLDQNMEEIITRTGSSERPKVPPLLIDDPIRPSDMSEVAKRLVILGFAKKEQPLRDEIISSALIKHFRRTTETTGPQGVTIGDLIALRRATPGIAPITDLSDY
jgi:hypothetical protein